MNHTGTDPNIAIVFEDDQLLVIDKPHGLLSQKDHTGDPDILTLSKEYLGRGKSGNADPYVGLLHRLDRPVSGLMILAKKPAAARKLSKQFNDHTVQKTYLAVVKGKTPVNGMLIHYLKKDREKNIVTALDKNTPRTKKAVLTYQRMNTIDELSLLSVHPQTGRPHQIRVQLAADGYPVFGDYKYGYPDQPKDRTLALHAYELSFVHPSDGKRLNLNVPVPGSKPWTYFKLEPDLKSR